MQILTIVGARPQFIKAAMVSHQLKATVGVREIIVHTGQHYDDNMSRVFFDELGIPEPDYHLKVGSGTHGVQTAGMLAAIEAVILNTMPDVVLVYGDTNSTLAGALAAVKLNVPVYHIEAGLRSFNRHMPEEVNRVLTDHVSTELFVPTPTAMDNLIGEGIQAHCIHLVGDVMFDAALHFGQLAQRHSGVLNRLGIVKNSYVLATVHRAENTNNILRLQYVLKGLGLIAQDLPVVVPLHPRTRDIMKRFGLEGEFDKEILFVDPLGYLDMVMLEKSASLIVTDSGGVQKEAFFHGIPCITIREETEWKELVEIGWNKLAPPLDEDVVYRAFTELRNNLPGFRNLDIYGDGFASRKIVEVIIQHS